MERLKERYNSYLDAVKSLEESLEIFDSIPRDSRLHATARDSVIKRFEYCIDGLWKLLKNYLEIKHGMLPISSPKGVIRDCRDAKVITAEQYDILIEMVESRNLTSHTYNVDLAERIKDEVAKFYGTFVAIGNQLNI